MTYRTTVFKGAILSVGMRWTDRLFGLVSMLILARLLAPADFGLVAMAMVAVGLVNVILSLGVETALIQNNKAERADFDTAWTLRLIQVALAAIIVILSAPLAADYYNDDRVADVMRLIAATVFLSGFANIGIVNFQKNMEFGRDFQYLFYKRLIGFVATIIAALLLRSYWALVIGSFFSSFAGVVLSYFFHTYRPRFSLARIRQLWSFSQWLLVRGVGNYLDGKLDKLIVGRRADAGVMGAYTIADEIASLPTAELLAPLSRVLFPAFVSVKENRAEIKRTFLLALAIQALVGIPAGTGLALVANETVLVLLGEKWQAAVPFMQVMAFINVVAAIGYSGGYMLLALGKVRMLGLYAWIQVVAFLILLLIVFPHAGPQEIALIRLGLVIIGLIIFISFVMSAISEIRIGDLFYQIWRPIVATIGMTMLLLAFAAPYGMPLVIVLVIKIAIGAFSYGGLILLFWKLAGCPDGGESYIFRKLKIDKLICRVFSKFRIAQ